MNLSQRFRVWLSKRWPVVLFIGLIGLAWIVQSWLQRPPPCITRTLGSSTQHVNVLWFKQGLSPGMITANANGILFAMPLAQDSLMAFDVKTGNMIWKKELSFEGSGVRALLANQDTVFVVNTLNVDAYETKTGELKWSTGLGQGHVTIISQLDSDILRVYYGDTIYELYSETGKLLRTIPKETIVWVSGNFVLKASPSHHLSAYNKQTGELLWDNRHLFRIDEGLVPQDMDQDILIIGYEPSASFIKGICALDLMTGKYNWCRPEDFESLMAIDHQSQLGYAMRSVSVLLTINLQTGNVLGETSFLSNEPENELSGFATIAISDGVVVVSFGDSLQTFGLKFLP